MRFVKNFYLSISTGLILLFTGYNSVAQTFQVNGDAVDHGNGLIKLTSSIPAKGAGVWQQSSAWNKVPIDLSQPFDKSFDMFFGCESGPDGGDGITFTFQNVGLNAIGGGGGNLGLNGINHAISIEFDTWNAGPAAGDIPEDHIAIDLNGDVTHGQPIIDRDGNYTTVIPVAGGRDLENCAENSTDYYSIRIKWDPVTMSLQLYENDETIPSVTYYDDIINTVFGGNSMVYWGFTSATGSASNEQWVAPKGSIIPWECTTNSCCPVITLQPIGIAPFCKDPLSVGLQGTFESYNWSNGDKTETAQITAPGTYTVNVLQKQTNGAMCPASTTFTINTGGPTAKISGTKTLCDNTQTTPLTIDLTGNAPYSFTYAIDGTPQPEITNITSTPYVIDGNAIHTYTLTSVKDMAGCNGQILGDGKATIDLFDGVPVGHDGSFTLGSSAELSVDNGGGNYTWYDAATGGNVVGNGLTFTTPDDLTSTTTYYVKNTLMTGFETKSAGLLNAAAGDVNPSDKNDGGLPKDVLYQNFTAKEDFLLNTITCAINVVGAWGPSSVSFDIIDLNDNTLSKFNIDSNVTTALPGGNQNFYMTLNYPCIKGHNYQIRYTGNGSIKGIMYWHLVSSFPINSTPEISLTSPDINTRPAQSYPGLFDWKITVKSPNSSCGLTPVTAYICPTGTITGNTTICGAGETSPLTITLTGNKPWKVVYAIDGQPQPAVSGITNSDGKYNFTSLPGEHKYTLISINDKNTGTCTANGSGSVDIKINTDKAVTNDSSFVSDTKATLTVEDAGGTYNWYADPTGGTSLGSGTTFTSPTTLNATTTFYVEHVINGVASCERSPATAYLCPKGAISGDANICDDGVSTSEITITLTGTPTYTIVYKIDDAVQTVTGITDNFYKFNSLPGPHNYTLLYVNNLNTNKCADISGTGTATIKVRPAKPETNDVSFTGPKEVTLSVVNPVGTYNWYADATGGTSLGSGTSFTTSEINATTTYYVEQVINGVASCERSPATAFLCPKGAIFGDAALCDDEKTSQIAIELTGTPTFTLVYKIDGVEQAPVTGISLSPYKFNSLPGAHTYTLVSVNNINTKNSCKDNITINTATITVRPDKPKANDASFTAPGTATLTVANTGGTYNWYADALGGTKLFTGPSYTTQTLNATTTYYVEQVINGVASCERSPATATPINIPVNPVVELFIPNLITPNADGKNDQMEILGLPAKSNLAIYNRWGSAVFQSDDYDNKWSGGDLEAGVYYYKLTLPNGKDYSGWLQLIR